MTTMRYAILKLTYSSVLEQLMKQSMVLAKALNDPLYPGILQ